MCWRLGHKVGSARKRKGGPACGLAELLGAYHLIAPDWRDFRLRHSPPSVAGLATCPAPPQDYLLHASFPALPSASGSLPPLVEPCHETDSQYGTKVGNHLLQRMEAHPQDNTTLFSVHATAEYPRLTTVRPASAFSIVVRLQLSHTLR